MLFKLNVKNGSIQPVKRIRLKDFDWDERKFQKLLFKNLERMIREEELLVIMQSRHWQEEPDLMAIDSNGELYIFELKAWESQSSNILQALRYGQIFGGHDYDQLNDIYQTHKKIKGKRNELITEFKRYFPDSEIAEEPLEKFNQKQHFIILTNGVDIKTREAVIYWRKQGLDVRSWIYRLHETEEGQIYLEMNTLSKEDNPFEDLEEGYFVVNTDKRYVPTAEKDMLKNTKAAAYYDPWKLKIDRLQKNGRVFLYSSGTGIIARGIAGGNVKKKAPHHALQDIDEEHYVELKTFQTIIDNPISAAEIKEITEINYRFMNTVFSMDGESGKKVWDEFTKRT